MGRRAKPIRAGTEILEWTQRAYLLGIVAGAEAYTRPLLTEDAASRQQEDALGAGVEVTEPIDADAITGLVVELRLRYAARAVDMNAALEERGYALGWLTGYGAVQDAYQDAYRTAPWRKLVDSVEVSNT